MFFNDTYSYINFYISKSGRLNIIYKWYFYEYINGKFVENARLPFTLYSAKSTFYMELMSVIGWDRALSFFKQLDKSPRKFFSSFDIHFKHQALREVAPNILALCRKDGCFLVDTRNTAIIDTLIYNKNVGSCNISADKALWLGTSGAGVYRFFKSSINVVKNSERPVQYIRAAKNGAYAVLEHGQFLRLVLDSNRNIQACENKQMLNIQNNEKIVFLGQDDHGDWISCGNHLSISNFLDKENFISLKSSSYKDVWEDDSGALILATLG